jgi:hypothetical protein
MRNAYAVLKIFNFFKNYADYHRLPVRKISLNFCKLEIFIDVQDNVQNNSDVALDPAPGRKKDAAPEPAHFS